MFRATEVSATLFSESKLEIKNSFNPIFIDEEEFLDDELLLCSVLFSEDSEKKIIQKKLLQSFTLTLAKFLKKREREKKINKRPPHRSYDLTIDIILWGEQL